MDEMQMEAMVKAFREVAINPNSTADDVARALLECDVLFVGLSQRSPAENRADGRYLGVAGYSCEECPSYINVFTDPEIALHWQNHYQRPLGVLYKADSFNGLFPVAALCHVGDVWINEGGEYGGFLSVQTVNKVSESEGGRFLFMSGGELNASGGMMISLENVKAPVIEIYSPDNE